MAPKLQLMLPSLQINTGADQQEDDAAACGSITLSASVRINPSGTFMCLTQSYSPVIFGPEGMSHKKGVHNHYMISERDIRVTKRLGAGASSTVFKGLFVKKNSFVAIKKIDAMERGLRYQMLNDIKALIDMPNLPGLIKFYGAFHVPNSGQISIVLEYMDAGSLADVVKVKRIPEDVLSKLTGKILLGLISLHKHKRMVHRDIKPANILINLEGEPKITDFGISAFIGATYDVCKTYVGTVTYMSPERIHNQTYSTPADIWSLGLVMVECATGKYPYNAAVGPVQLMMEVLNEELPIPPSSDFSEEFRDFVTQCLQKDPAMRPAAEVLLHHPYITKYKDVEIDLKAFMQCVFDANDKLDENAVVIAWNYYGVRSASPERWRKELQPFYSETSTLIHDGEKAVGRRAIMSKFKAIAHLHAGVQVMYHVQQVDCQPLGTDGSVMVHVQGTVQAIIGPAGGAATANAFTECFIFSQLETGDYFISSQAFRLLKQR